MPLSSIAHIQLQLNLSGVFWIDFIFLIARSETEQEKQKVNTKLINERKRKKKGECV